MGIERRYKRQQERDTLKLRQRIHEQEMKKMNDNPELYLKQVEQYLKNLKEHYDKQQEEQPQEQSITKLRGA
jgi:hypothetical protein